MNDNKEINGEGLLTEIWGQPTWDTLHCITYGYPKNPTNQDKDDYLAFFKILRKVLPCCTCRDHYSQFIASGDTALTREVLENRKSLTYWMYALHSAIDKKLGMVYNISYTDCCEKYESYIADCQMTPEMKIVPFKNYYNKEAPYVPCDIVLCFSDYAQKRGIHNFSINATKMNELNKKSNDWIKRNELCWDIIKKMRLSAISSVEVSGEFEGFPTINELGLLQCLSTTMNQKHIKRMLEKLETSLKKN